VTCAKQQAPGVSVEVTTARRLCSVLAAVDCHSLAVVGLAKNAGKTTVVNALLANCGRRLGLTSLGLDGERTDHLTGLAKPGVAPPVGTLVATTEGSLMRSHYDMEVLETLPWRTPLGSVVIGRARGQGQVEVSGPTTLAELRTTIDRLRTLGAERVIVDGAINRLGSASPRVSDGVVVATGGMVGESLEDVLETTAGALEMLLLPGVSGATRARVAGHAAAGTRAVAYSRDGTAEVLELATVVGEGVAVAREVQRLGAHLLLIGGAVTEEFAADFTRVLPPRSELRLVVRDATVLVMPPAAVRRFLRRGIRLEVLTPLRVLAVTVNPFRLPQPYCATALFAAVAGVVDQRLPLFDVVHELARLPVGRPPRSHQNVSP